MAVEYKGDYPVPVKWRNENMGEVASFTYRMDLDDLIEINGIDEMNDYLDGVLGSIVLSDITYDFAYAEDELPSAKDVLIRATGTIEEF